MNVEFQDSQVAESDHTVMLRDFDASVWGSDAREAWKALRAAGPLVEPRPGILVAASTAAVEQILRQPNLFSSNPEAAYFGSESGAIPLQVDPPEHVTYRKLLDPLFSPKRMAQREPEVAKLVNEFIDGFIEEGSCDFVADFAVPFPSAMFLGLMGLPYEDLSTFLWAKDGMIRPEGNDEETRKANMEKTSAWIFSYFATALDKKLVQPADDILSYFVQLETEGRLTRDETLNICLLLIAAGLDTVTDTLGCSFAFLAQNPEYQRQLVREPILIPAAVEELMRFETPVPLVNRIAMEDTVVDGCPVHAKQRMRVMLAIANHDPEIFGNPDTVDFTRPVNPHIGFGGGVHRCLGSHLARLELRVATREWHRRISSYQPPQGFQIRYRPALREIVSLPLEFARGPREG